MRTSETLCYIKLNGNRAALDAALEQRAGCEDSCIRWYDINDNKGTAEIVISGYRRDLAKELRGSEITEDEIRLAW